jgi:hypothetical protein
MSGVRKLGVCAQYVSALARYSRRRKIAAPETTSIPLYSGGNGGGWTGLKGPVTLNDTLHTLPPTPTHVIDQIGTDLGSPDTRSSERGRCCKQVLQFCSVSLLGWKAIASLTCLAETPIGWSQIRATVQFKFELRCSRGVISEQYLTFLLVLDKKPEHRSGNGYTSCWLLQRQIWDRAGLSGS